MPTGTVIGCIQDSNSGEPMPNGKNRWKKGHEGFSRGARPRGNRRMKWHVDMTKRVKTWQLQPESHEDPTSQDKKATPKGLD